MTKKIIILIMTFLPIMVLAEEEGGFFERIWALPAIFWQILNIVLVIILFYYILKDKAPQFFKGRSRDIEKAWMEAVRDKEEAEKRLADVEERMSHLNKEMKSIEETSRMEAEQMKAKMVENAKREREILLKEGQRELERRLKEAKAEITAHAAHISEGLAREMLSKMVTKEDEEHLFDQALRSIEGERIGKTG